MTGKEVFAAAISMLIGKPSENPELEEYSLLLSLIHIWQIRGGKEEVRKK